MSNQENIENTQWQKKNPKSTEMNESKYQNICLWTTSMVDDKISPFSFHRVNAKKTNEQTNL